ncbi:MAG: gamma-glutamylcyclotransferase, partial [Marmoricola sp.]|nr:gamma-glutamylcyclotransferase [Marmoricola sp.]
MTLYAAYGNNLDPVRMSERCPHSPLRETGWLEGWRLTFGGEEHGWDGALATIVQDPFEQVFVAIYDVTDEDVASLDGWESADTGLFRKTKVRVS